jgi:hypothetical protein
MTKGIWDVEYIRQGSEVSVANAPNWDFLYRASTVIDPRWNVGDRVVTPDGRVFRYAKAGGTIHTEFAVCSPFLSITNAVAPAQSTINGPILNQLGGSVTQTAGQVGVAVVTLTVASGDGFLGTGAIAADELRGGFVVIGNGTSQHPQTRGIIGNSVVAAGGGSCDVYLDASLTTAVTVGTTNIEAYLPLYGNVQSMNTVNSAYVTCIGAAAVEATSGQYFFVQTWGNVWLTSNNATGEAANGRDIYVNTDGSVRGQTSTTYAGYQRIGTGLDKSASNASNGPNIMLQISI